MGWWILSAHPLGLTWNSLVISLKCRNRAILCGLHQPRRLWRCSGRIVLAAATRLVQLTVPGGAVVVLRKHSSEVYGAGSVRAVHPWY
jgi:hypothetical protein